MKTLYIDCGMGAAGDMMTAALLELLSEKEQAEILEKLRNMGLEGVSISSSKVSKCGIMGTHMKVLIDGMEETSDDVHDHEHHNDHEHKHDHGHGHHHHMHMSDIEAVIGGFDIPERVRRNALSVYTIIAEAESHVHGAEVSEVHFHEVGMKDAIIDVTAVCLLMDHISPDRVIASPVHVGSGQVKCAHGIMPVPAPATAFILRNIPIYSSDIKGELCTPTGAALLKFFVDEFGSMPVMTAEYIGYGMGSKDFPRANCLRVILGETGYGGKDDDAMDKVVSLSCNVDDMTGEELGFAIERLYELGAKDVYTIPTGMKKSRPGIILTVLCSPEDRIAMVRAIFKHTTTIGIREAEYNRYILSREEKTKDTIYGTLHFKHSEGYGVSRDKYEYEELAETAREKGLSIRELLEKIRE
ncbi:MAG: nickel pincer cofactor biosynthesis protein LarC [Lachnospiraceae bacterium]|nr:nickel pincer cofactor biosynthesis protein LarC [Lachnospiraceae bacterium]